MYVVEITGVAGVGKSFIFKDILKKSTLQVRNFVAYVFFLKYFSFKIFYKIFQISFNTDFSFLNKLNFIRNTMLKLGKLYYYKSIESNDIVIVDEGISHLFQNIVSTNKLNNNNLIILVKEFLELIIIEPDKVVFVQSTYSLIESRLINRGHKRLKNQVEAKVFLANGINSQEQCKLYFKDKIKIINNIVENYKLDEKLFFRDVKND